MTREEKINTLKAIIQECEDYQWQRKITLYEIIKDLEQEPKTGHWITKPHIYGVAFCSECGFELRIDDTKYCPNCGAQMAESEG